MPQISLYIDEKTLKKVESVAAMQHVSISKWVANQIKLKVDPVYPADFESLFGSISSEDWKQPKSVPCASDSHRESF